MFVGIRIRVGMLMGFVLDILVGLVFLGREVPLSEVLVGARMEPPSPASEAVFDRLEFDRLESLFHILFLFLFLLLLFHFPLLFQ